MSFYSVAAFIRDNYPEYFGYQTYPIADCVRIRKVAEEWGVFCNFYATPIVVDGVTFKNAEQVFQLMKFKDPEIIKRIWNGITANDKICHEVKRTVKSYEKAHRRPDWGTMILDALKFALVQKYEQCELFRKELERSKGLFIAEDETSRMRGRDADTWGVVLRGEEYVGPSLLGRMLMELREEGKLEYTLPEDALDFVKQI
jgi:predicted NAD-dependent protein-ADP-ribosyltransferase YbiA (DUF1768 family)